MVHWEEPYNYTHFGDVVIFHTTDTKTKLYNLPSDIFVGVNNHFQSAIFGEVLLKSEKVEDFEWTFSTFLDIMPDAAIMSNAAPKTILTGTSFMLS